MKQVSLQDLKQRLSAFVAEAASGDTIVITRHQRPMAQLSSAELQHLHLGASFGKSTLKRVLRGKTQGRYLRVLLEDREDGH